MTMQQDNSAVLDKVYDALNKHDATAVAAQATSDVSVDVIPWTHTATGQKAVEDNYRNFFHAFPDISYTSVGRIQQGDTIVDEWIIRGTHRGELSIGKIVVQPTNQHFEIRGINVYDFSGGKVRRMRIYYDALSFASQLGISQLLQARAAGQ